jgi:hypothetical protein
MPELWISDSEDERSTAGSRSSALDVLGMRLVECYFDRAAGICTTVYSNVDWRFLVIVSRLGDLANLSRSCLRPGLVSQHAQLVPIRAILSAKCHYTACTRSYHRGLEFAFRSELVPCLPNM